MENNELDLSQLRQRIDQLDHEIARLLTERMEISGKVAAYKKANNLPIYHPEREKQVIEKVCALTKAEYREPPKFTSASWIRAKRPKKH